MIVTRAIKKGVGEEERMRKQTKKKDGAMGRERWSNVALSTIEGEFMVTTEASKEMLWLKFLEVRFKQKMYALFCDNQSTIHLDKNSSFHSRSKYIDVRSHWIRDVLDKKLLELEKIHMDHNGSDTMTKTLLR